MLRIHYSKLTGYNFIKCEAFIKSQTQTPKGVVYTTSDNKKIPADGIPGEIIVNEIEDIPNSQERAPSFGIEARGVENDFTLKVSEGTDLPQLAEDIETLMTLNKNVNSVKVDFNGKTLMLKQGEKISKLYERFFRSK
jgi:hypothetical protein